jgi:hypothetical protein
MLPIDTKRGTKVICIDDSGMGHYDLNSKPRKGQIYTVREIVPTQREHGVRFLEIQNPTVDYDIGGIHEPCFSLTRFQLLP